jgi:RNA polymerase sigma-70 factor (ECF subfamily)
MPARLADSSDPQHLLHRAQAGDGPALGKLLERYSSYLTLLARLQIDRRLQGKVDAADLVQETFLEAHRDFAQFRGTTPEEWAGWLRQILATNVANQVRRYLGTRARDVRLERRLVVELEASSQALDRGLAASQSTPSEQAARREQALLLAEALQQMPESYREVIILRQLQGLSFPEVSRCMGRSLDSVKNLWARALARLARLLGETA